MIRSIPTVPSSSPSHHHTDYAQFPAIATTTVHRTSLRTTISLDYGTAALSASGRGITLPVLRCSTPTAAEAASTNIDLDSAATTVRKFYDAFNCRDLAAVEDLIAPDCVYEDLIFSQPFTGRKAILDFFRHLIDSIADLQFAIDDISEDTSAVGVTWHLEWKGKPFPISRGCSFYRLEVIDGLKQIVFGRDAVEPTIKPGETALVAIRGVTWLLQNIPLLGDRL